MLGLRSKGANRYSWTLCYLYAHHARLADHYIVGWKDGTDHGEKA